VILPADDSLRAGLGLNDPKRFNGTTVFIIQDQRRDRRQHESVFKAIRSVTHPYRRLFSDG
jgi:hypothetical protein